MARIAAALHALVSKVIDYAGLYPPASLPLAIVSERYRAFLASPDSWLLNRLVLPADQFAAADVADDWRITLLVTDEPGALPPQVQTLETKSPRVLSLPTYCEAPLAEISGGWAKVRTGGLAPESIPTSEELAEFLYDAAARRVPFKATAGLHHPIRSVHPLTNSPDGPRAAMHGFLNVFLAACFAWHGADRSSLTQLLDETDPAAFEFDDAARWRDRTLAASQIAAARYEFAHSFGSCSFEDPVNGLRELGLMP